MKAHSAKQSTIGAPRLERSDKIDANQKPGSLFGTKLRELRKRHDIPQRELARHLGVSPAYLSQLESGKKGRPSDRIIHAICQQFNLIWDEADTLFSLADSSKRVVKIDTTRLDERKTELAKLFSDKLGKLTGNELDFLEAILVSAPHK